MRLTFPNYAGKHTQLSTPLVTHDFGSPEIQRGLAVLVDAAIEVVEAERS